MDDLRWNKLSNRTFLQQKTHNYHRSIVRASSHKSTPCSVYIYIYMYERSKVFRYSLERSKATLFSRFDKEENWLIGGARSTTRWPSSAATPWRNIYLALFSRFRAYASYFARINWSVLSTRMCIFPYVIITSRDKVNLVAFNSIVQSNEERERERLALTLPEKPER